LQKNYFCKGVSIVYRNVDEVYKEISQIIEAQQKEQNISDSVSLGDMLSRVIVISAASEFEYRLREAMKQTSQNKDLKIQAFIDMFAGRNFWNMFSLKKDTHNINQFLKYFGDTFKETINNKIQGDNMLKDALSSFIGILLNRNNLVHEGVLSYNLDLSYQDSYSYYKKSLILIELLETEIKRKEISV
jgi:hypothetical protein